MRCLGIVACATALATLPTSAQTTRDKFFEQGEFDAAELRSLGAFDTLASWYDRSGVGVDTTVVISDSLWMSVLWISDVDSVPDDKGSWLHRGGVCEYVFLITTDPRTLRAKALRRIRPECDVDHSIRDATYYSHRILAPTIVEIVSSKPRWYKKDDDDWEELVPFETRTFKVLPTGGIADMGVGIIPEPGLWKP